MSKINNCLTNLDNSCIPIWFMRQAGNIFLNLRFGQKIRLLKTILNSDLAMNYPATFK